MGSGSKQPDEPKSKLFGWLRLKRAAEVAGSNGAADCALSRNLSRESRQQLLHNISDFLMDHDLELSHQNLNFAYDILSGSNPRLAHLVTGYLQSGGAINQIWVNNLGEKHASDDDHRHVEQMIDRLETQMENFQTQTNQARRITVQYESELERHVGELENIANAGDLVSDLAELARTMLERTRRAEQDMRRSEGEVRLLRRSLARARRDAEIDHLTGLPNRRAFEALLTRQYQEARERCENMSVAFCDIDEFKRVNDVHGHESGDRVIKVIAETLARISDDHCHVARHGGEEFVMLFRGLTPAEAAKKLDRARESIAQRKLINRKTDQPFGTITFSAGVADVFRFSNVREALRAADEALYLAKEKGRNRIEIA